MGYLFYFLTMTNSRFLYALRAFVGVIFMLSGILKAFSASAFANLMSSYGATWLGYGAPLIIAVELFLGMLLIFNALPRLMSAVSVAFIVIVSAIFLYGILCCGITDCGCFGPLTWLNTRPWITFLRNAIIIALLIPSLCRPQEGAPLTIPSVLCMALATVILMYMCGYTMHGAKCLQRAQKPYEPRPLAEHPLAQLISCDPDSTYVVFAFSYGCPFCQNSIGNVNQFTSMHVVDRVIGLAITDSVGRERFDRIFDYNFGIKEIPDIEMYKITSSLPVTFYIRHDSIINALAGSVTTPALSIP